ncbi:acyltransferase family protein [Tianweitania populi]|uniref:Acyltransferase n=1 Tax=Tianweitania populi TaxID=1607949 RepID=A0A8J3GLP2_9HYPH|nr:acyltransferase [Tianweitania populi]GHD12823.1 acyltransferase [Tianweitania populi]
MKSRNLRYIPEIDQLRLLAALLVFAFHFFHMYKGGWVPLPQYAWLGLITEGHTGVALFFVLSGFIFMTIAAEGEAIAYTKFLRNRLLRIAPLFLTVFVVAISIHRDRFVATDLLYVFVTNIGNPPTSWHLATGPAWSISVEFAFYLVFPFLAQFVRERGAAYLVKLILMMLVIKLGAYLAAENSKLMLYSTLVGRFDQFLIGMLAGLAYHRRKDWLNRHGRLLFFVASLVTIVAVGVQARYASSFLPDQKQPFWIIWGTIEAACWAGVILGFVRGGISFGERLDRVFATCGAWSFSIYMWHAMILFTAHELFGSVGGTGIVALGLNAAVLLGATLAFSWLSYSVIEQPFLNLRTRYVEAPAKA